MAKPVYSKAVIVLLLIVLFSIYAPYSYAQNSYIVLRVTAATSGVLPLDPYTGLASGSLTYIPVFINQWFAYVSLPPGNYTLVGVNTFTSTPILYSDVLNIRLWINYKGQSIIIALTTIPQTLTATLPYSVTHTVFTPLTISLPFGGVCTASPIMGASPTINSYAYTCVIRNNISAPFPWRTQQNNVIFDSFYFSNSPQPYGAFNHTVLSTFMNHPSVNVYPVKAYYPAGSVVEFRIFNPNDSEFFVYVREAGALVAGFSVPPFGNYTYYYTVEASPEEVWLTDITGKPFYKIIIIPSSWAALPEPITITIPSHTQTYNMTGNFTIDNEIISGFRKLYNANPLILNASFTAAAIILLLVSPRRLAGASIILGAGIIAFGQWLTGGQLVDYTLIGLLAVIGVIALFSER